MTATTPLNVAIIGGGIAGAALGIGLQARGINFRIYERSPSFREVGAGIGLSPNAERTMKLIDPDVHKAFKVVAMPNGEDYFQWINGMTNEVMYKLYMGENGFQGCRRTDFLDEMSKLVPKDKVGFGMEATDVVELESGKVRVRFADGTETEADVVIGCDGIHSRVRKLMLGPDSPAARAGYTGKYCFRALVPMDKAVAALGPHRPSTRFMFNGPNAHIMTYPVAHGKQLNVLTVITDPNPWTEPKHTTTGDKKDALAAYDGWHPQVKAIIDLLPDEMDKWAIFDMLENPAPSYCSKGGLVALAGDAAHSSGPHLGSGAGFGLEDALVLMSGLKAVAEEEENGSEKSRPELVRRALGVYNEMRYDRTQWLIDHTRQSAELFQWQREDGKENDSYAREITWRFLRIWDYDVVRMASETAVKVKEGKTTFRYRWYN
ncbi:uncharacterized protein MKZ38_002278 [Zalerion maritima]|uniref:FAD-binding domain-containing protein n=1 Tax=Zalerion maritima TaxID=339359 RepID=A0AAD5RP54_9PEZI|nr:uncharacterized protein MKZ38_002278 [Zalerion maritima]